MTEPRAAFKELIHSLTGLISAAILVLGATLFYLHFIGFPDWFETVAYKQLEKNGVLLEADGIRLGLRGIEVQNARIDLPRGNTIFEAPKLILSGLPGKNSGRWRFSVVNATLHTGRLLNDSTGDPLPELKHIHAGLETDGTVFILNKGFAEINRVRLNIAGEYRTRPTQTSGSAETGQPFRLWRNLLSSFSEWQFDAVPRLTVRFQLDAEYPDRDTVTLQCSTGGFHIRENSFSGLDADVSLKNTLLDIRQLEIRQSDRRRITAAGQWNIPDQSGQLHLENTLGTADICVLLPEQICNPIRRHTISWGFPGWIADVEVGKPDGQYTLHGRVSCPELSVRETDFENAAAEIKLSPEAIRIPDFKADVTTGGVLQGSAEISLVNPHFNVKLDAFCDPGHSRHFVSPAIAEHLERFRFTQREKWTLECSRSATREWNARGTLAASGKLNYSNTNFDQLNLSFNYKDHTLEFTGIRAVRPEGKLEGSFVVDFKEETIDFYADSTVDPDALLAMAEIRLAPAVRILEFYGPAHLNAAGIYDLNRHASVIHGFLRGENLRIEPFSIDRAETGFSLTGTELQLTDTRLATCGGTISGTTRMLLGSAESRPFKGALLAENINNSLMLRQLAPDSPHAGAAGILNGSIAFDADLEKPFPANLNASGWLAVTQGRLFEIPLLREFTKLARLINPGFDFFSQTELAGMFDIESGTLHTSDLQLKGKALTLTAAGTFNRERGYNMRVRMKPLSEDNPALYKLVKTLSMPVSRLLEFKLEGPLSNPSWSFANIPSARLPNLMNLLRGTENQPADSASE